MSHHEKPGPREGIMMKNSEDDTEGHGFSAKRKVDGSEDDTEGHGFSAKRKIDESDDDVEGHRMKVK